MATIQKNKAVIETLYAEALNRKNLGLLQDLVSEDYAGPQGLKGAAGFEAPIAPLIKAFPDMQWKLENIIGDGDKVAVNWKLQGTHTGQFQQFAPTGKTITNEGMAIFQLKDGKITGVRTVTDRVGFLQELGGLPADLTQLPNGKAGKDQVTFIDKFLIPANATQEFHDRMKINRDFIKKLPGFIEDAAYEYTDNNGNLVCVTVARWKSMEALNKAREAVQEEYKKEGFDPAAMFKRLNITADRGIYTAL